MESYLIWLIAGLALIIAELASGTFYLLVLGVAALVGSAMGYFGGSFFTQALSTSVVAVTGVIIVNRWRRNRAAVATSADNMDVGQAVVFDSWVNETARLMRVKYRGTTWDAQLVGEAPAGASDLLYICGSDGSRLRVSRSKPG